MTRTAIISFARNESGAVSIEMALIGSLFLVLLIGILEISIMLFAKNSVHAAVDEISRLGRQSGVTPTEIVDAWRGSGSAAPFANQMTVDARCFAGLADLLNAAPEVPCAGAAIVEWTVSLHWQAITPMMSWLLSGDYNLGAAGVSYR